MDNRDNIELIKERIDILTLVERYVKLKPAGKNFVGLCPFHTEKTPSFNVSPDIQIYKCFGCGESGDIFSFLQKIEGLEFVDALKKLAKEAGITLEDNNKKAVSPIVQINKWASLYYQNELFEKRNEVALNYLLNRGIDRELIKKFELGYSPGNGEFLKRLNSYQKFPKKVLIDSGLFIEKNGILKEKFNKRVLFPIHSVFGTTIAFTGRLLPGNDFGPKYLHTAETPLFKKRFNVYGIYQAKSYIRKEDFCIILEGSTDVIALYKLGIKNAVASLGTSLMASQLEIISRYTKNMVFVFDSDNAGQKALERTFLLTSQLGLNSYALNPAPYKDIDEMAQKAPKELLSKVEERVDTFTYLLSSKVESLDLTKLNSSIKLDAYIKGLLDEVTEPTIKEFFRQKAEKIRGGEQSANSKNDNYNPTGQTQQYTNAIKGRKDFDNVEDSLLAYVIRNGTKDLPDTYTFELFESEINQEIGKYLFENPEIKYQEILKHYETNLTFKDRVERLLMKDTENLEIEKLFKRIYTVYLSKQMREIRMNLAAAEEKGDQTKINKLLSQVQKLTDKLKKIKHENI